MGCRYRAPPKQPPCCLAVEFLEAPTPLASWKAQRRLLRGSASIMMPSGLLSGKEWQGELAALWRLDAWQTSVGAFQSAMD